MPSSVFAGFFVGVLLICLFSTVYLSVLPSYPPELRKARAQFPEESLKGPFREGQNAHCKFWLHHSLRGLGRAKGPRPSGWKAERNLVVAEGLLEVWPSTWHFPHIIYHHNGPRRSVYCFVPILLLVETELRKVKFHAQCHTLVISI